MREISSLVRQASQALYKQGYRKEAKLLLKAAAEPDIPIEKVHDRYMFSTTENIDDKDWFHTKRDNTIREQVFKSPTKITEEQFRNWYEQWADVTPRDDIGVWVENTSDGGTIAVVTKIEKTEEQEVN